MIVLRGIEKDHIDLKNAIKLPYLGYTHTHILTASPVLQGPREEGGGGPGREKSLLCGFSSWGEEPSRVRSPAGSPPNCSFFPGRRGGALLPAALSAGPGAPAASSCPEATLGPASPRARAAHRARADPDRGHQERPTSPPFRRAPGASLTPEPPFVPERLSSSVRSSVQLSRSVVSDSATPCTAARQASQSRGRRCLLRKWHLSGDPRSPLRGVC